ncbi:hypothetical protein B0H17DRAFT_864523, partial [Mycena rosella]
MIFAGDFAQLPPVKASTLYSPDSQVSSFIHTKMGIPAQKQAIGKIIWQQVTTVVILKQNMRQTATTADDCKLRTALENMRFGACTPADIEYLKTRTISRRPGHPTFSEARFRHVSIITGLNAQKDKINELGCQKFAEETGQELTHFYSDDILPGNAGSQGRKKKSERNKEDQLWAAQPSSTDCAVAGKLSLCIGLPVMIRNNDATELCITKGQEGRVVGWHEAQGNRGQRILDTLFVELENPPHPVSIPGLPQNVVALVKATKKTWCSLPDDMMVQVSRDQVLILPNFAMTDYSSQGKTRELNVVDLNNCRTHFSYYTALSRSSTSDGTVILQGMQESKITRGISGYLRQEFRELELLNEITALRYENDLPVTVQGVNRKEILRAYQIWK